MRCIPDPFCNGPNAAGEHPLQFHVTHGANVQLSANKRIARRIGDETRGICYSNRPIAVNERVYVKVRTVARKWKEEGDLGVGFTTCDPAALDGKVIPPHLLWGTMVPRQFAKRGTVLLFYVTPGRDVMYGANGVQKGLLLSGVNSSSHVWAMIDMYGSTTSVEFVGEGESISINW